MLNRETILQKQDALVDKVEVPEWGGEIYVRLMSAKERDKFEQMMSGDKSKLRNVRGQFVCLVACDDKGVRIFKDEDADALGEKSLAPMQRIYEAALKINAMGATQIEELEKNS